jgi:L-fuconolactonase
MPPFPIIDAHLHLWDPTHFRMPWLDGNAVLDQPYSLADYHTQTAGIAIEAMVYLQVEVSPAYALLEAQWVRDRAQEDARLKGLVAWAPIEDGQQARAYLDALVNFRPLVKGIRRVTQTEPIDFLVQPRVADAVRLLPSYDLTCDLCIYHPQLANAITLVRKCSETTFILDHIGKPAIGDGLLDPWRAQILELASLPNVSCKISGMATEANHERWTPSDLQPYLEHVLQAFGEDRVVFGGDWPVVTQASSYHRWVDTLDVLTSKLSEQARRKLWAENARRFYRLAQ